MFILLFSEINRMIQKLMMPLIKLTFLFFLLFLPAGLLAQGIKGTITNSAEEAIPFATVYVPELYKGTTANIDGEYVLELPRGTHKIQFQYLGYKTQNREAVITDDYQVLDILMESQQYQLPEVIVNASGEDPAYYIMRRAIAMSQYYLNQVSAYSAEVYLKGSGVITDAPRIVRRQLEKEGVETDQYFVTETLSEIEFKLPGNTQTRVISTRTSGDSNDTSPMSFISMSLYRDINGIISPLSRRAFQVYRFKLDGSFMEDGRQINRIRVIPRRKGNDLYSGHIYIKDETWGIHSVDLEVEQSLFTVRIRQVCNAVTDQVWMPVSHDYDIKVSVMGFHMEYKYLATVSNYQVKMNPDLDHGFYASMMRSDSDFFLLEKRKADVSTNPQAPGRIEQKSVTPSTPRQERIAELMDNENLNNRQMRKLNRLIARESKQKEGKRSLEIRQFSMEMDDSAKVRTTEYWEKVRPVPLADYEKESFREMQTTGQGQKSTSPFRDILLGTSVKINEQWSVDHNGILGISSYGFNTVDGFVFSKKAGVRYNSISERKFFLSNTSSWAFARNRFLTAFHTGYTYHPFKRAAWELETGRISDDFNGKGMNPLINSVYTLFWKQNPMKLYEKEFLTLSHSFDIINGLVLTTSVEYADRKPLENHSDFHLTSWGSGGFTPNMPFTEHENLDSGLLSTAFITNAEISYTHNYYYIKTGRTKRMMYSDFPTITFRHKRGNGGFLDGNARFDLLELSLNQSFDVKLLGQFSYYLLAGSFVNKENLFMPDLKYFPTQDGILMSGNHFNTFRTPGIYQNATSEDYLTAHFQYDHSRLFLKRLPFLSKTLIREKLFFNTLFVKGQSTLVEAGYGLDQIFLMFSAEIVTSFYSGKHHYTGFRLKLPLSGGEIRL